MPSPMDAWSTWFVASSVPTAFNQQLPSYLLPSPSSRPSSSSSSTPHLLELGTGRSSLWPSPSPLLASCAATDPFRLGTPLVVPKVRGLECPYVALCLLCPPVRRPNAPLFGLLTATSHLPDRSSYSTFAQPCLNSASTPPNTPGTPFAEERLHGWLCKALTPKPSSSSAGGTQIAIDNILTVLLPSATQWWPPPSIQPGKAHSSLLVLPGKTPSSNLAEPLAPLQ
ncbi:uncharacterized protein UHOD_12025 [Ustilago sp. UG-2017b]|nr:uncharacterized protein UHOD_12025 [Ustilago sp. UG-2017b]